MSKQKITGTNLESWIHLLESKNGVARLKARTSLVALGRSSVPSLIRVLQNSKQDHVRWEAAKTLGAIGDVRSIPALVSALEDSDQGVVWLAAEALRKFKKIAWPQLMRALVNSKPDSVLLRHGAHHVLRNQKEAGFNDLLSTLRIALESSTSSESTPFAASHILKRVKTKS
ncbi:MAG: HEAT repeat domain-containing protein [Ignavibacteriae bacterium]|nr:MAG: HEAT repeat domain-containing protein [Ignavibacteriota bacterium]